LRGHITLSAILIVAVSILAILIKDPPYEQQQSTTIDESMMLQLLGLDLHDSLFSKMRRREL